MGRSTATANNNRVYDSDVAHRANAILLKLLERIERDLDAGKFDNHFALYERLRHVEAARL